MQTLHKDYWVGDLFGEELKKTTQNGKNTTNRYSTVLKKISDIYTHLKEFWTIYLVLDSSSHPIIVTSILSNSISFTTGVLLDSLIRWSSSIKITEQYVCQSCKEDYKRLKGLLDITIKS